MGTLLIMIDGALSALPHNDRSIGLAPQYGQVDTSMVEETTVVESE
jgi:hypothetical protein